MKGTRTKSAEGLNMSIQPTIDEVATVEHL